MRPLIDEFPRIYDPDRPEQPVKTYAFIARRFVTGPCTVEKLVRIDDEDEARLMVLGGADWHAEGYAEWLAREMLRAADCDNDGDKPQRFVAEVLAQLPRDGWELPFEDVRTWSAKNFPQPVLPPRSSLEDLSEQALWELGLLDDEGADEE